MTRTALCLLLCWAPVRARAGAPAREPDARERAYAEALAAKAELEPRLKTLAELRSQLAEAPDPEPLLPMHNRLLKEIQPLIQRFYQNQLAFNALNREFGLTQGAKMLNTGKSKPAGAGTDLMAGLAVVFEAKDKEKALSDYITGVNKQVQEESDVIEQAEVRAEARGRSRRNAATAAGLAACALVGLGGWLLLRQRRRPPPRVETVSPPALEPPRPAAAASIEMTVAGLRVIRKAAPCTFGERFHASGPDGRRVLLTRLGGVPRDGERKVALLQALRRVFALRHADLAVQEVLDEGQEVYLALEDPGRSLREVLDAARPPAAWCRAALWHSALGLAFAHSKGAIHGGLTPEDIRVAQSGAVRVSGLAVGSTLRAALGRGSGQGAPAYLAPEQEVGVDRPESDVFALGVILFELAAGSLPFPGPNFSMQKREGGRAAADLRAPGWPAGLGTVLAKTLEPDPERRFRSCQEFIAALGALK